MLLSLEEDDPANSSATTSELKKQHDSVLASLQKFLTKRDTLDELILSRAGLLIDKLQAVDETRILYEEVWELPEHQRRTAGRAGLMQNEVVAFEESEEKREGATIREFIREEVM